MAKNEDNPQAKDMSFRSASIAQIKKPDYFKKDQKESPKRTISPLKKLIIIIAGVLILLILTLLILWLTLWRPKPVAQIPELPPAKNWQEERRYADYKAYALADSGSDAGLADALDLYEQKLAGAKDSAQKFDIRLARSFFLSEKEQPDKAVAYLLEVKDSELDDVQKYRLYHAFKLIYQKLDNADEIKKYEQKLADLPEGVGVFGTSQEGAANE